MLNTSLKQGRIYIYIAKHYRLLATLLKLLIKNGYTVGCINLDIDITQNKIACYNDKHIRYAYTIMYAIFLY